MAHTGDPAAIVGLAPSSRVEVWPGPPWRKEFPRSRKSNNFLPDTSNHGSADARYKCQQPEQSIAGRGQAFSVSGSEIDSAVATRRHKVARMLAQSQQSEEASR